MLIMALGMFPPICCLCGVISKQKRLVPSLFSVHFRNTVYYSPRHVTPWHYCTYRHFSLIEVSQRGTKMGQGRSTHNMSICSSYTRTWSLCPMSHVFSF